MQRIHNGGKDSLFNKWCWENWISKFRRMKLNTCLILYTKIISKWIKDLNVRPEAMKLLEGNIESKLLDTGLSNDILNLTPKAKVTKALKKMEVHQIKKLLQSKGNSQQNEKVTYGTEENICKLHIQ